MKSLLDVLWSLSTVVVIAGTLLPAGSTAMETLARLNLNDKLEHFGAYFALALLPTLHRRGRFLAAILVLTFALGIVLEYGQLYSPGRSFDVWDMAADAGGTAMGFCAGMLLRTIHVRSTAS